MTKAVTLGLKENWQQFTWLVLVNALVGAFIGIERSIFPTYAFERFGITNASAMLLFIAAFGLSKALTNYFSGRVANRLGRRKLLIYGWLIGIPVPLLFMIAPNWAWVIVANILLGINQGITWSSTVVMKIDLVGIKRRGLAMGINESAGYVAVALSSYLAAYLANQYGVKTAPFYIGIVLVVLGLLLSVWVVKDTQQHAALEQLRYPEDGVVHQAFKLVSYKNLKLSSITQAGLVNNLNDGVFWGLFPYLLASKGFDLLQSAQLIAVMPIFWGVGQLFTGILADKVHKPTMLLAGMVMQAMAFMAIPFFNDYLQLTLLAALLGLGTAMVYPVFLVLIADYSQPAHRAENLGVFRFWRDLGYAMGALLFGLWTGIWSADIIFLTVGVLTVVSGGYAFFRLNRV